MKRFLTVAFAVGFTLICASISEAKPVRGSVEHQPCFTPNNDGMCQENLYIGTFLGYPPTPFDTIPKSKRGRYAKQSYGGDLIARARRFLGQTASQIGLHRTSLWCAAFMNKITGGGTGSDLAKSFASFGAPASRGCVNCIAVLSRGRRGGHVGVVSGYDGDGNPIIISGNHGRRVGEGVYPVRRVIAWRWAAL